MDTRTARRERLSRPWPVVTAAALLLVFEALWAYSGTYTVVYNWSWWTGDVHDRMYGEIFLNLGLVLLAIALLYFALTVGVVRGRRRARAALIVPTLPLITVAAWLAASLSPDSWTLAWMAYLSSPLLAGIAVVLLFLPASRPFFVRRGASGA